jgi:hypothetical protein
VITNTRCYWRAFVSEDNWVSGLNRLFWKQLEYLTFSWVRILHYLYNLSMGQKINALGLRLKNRTNWNATFCTQDLKSYSRICINNQQLERTTDLLFLNFHLFSNNTIIAKNSKNFQIYTKALQKKDIIQTPLDFKNSERVELLKNEKQSLKKLFLGSKNAQYVFSDIFFNKHVKNYTKIANEQFLVLAPKIITNYITNQLNKKGILKRSSFATNLNLGIILFCRQLLKRIQNNIVGLKIVCSGKWKKTKSGRKQKITVKLGRIVSPSISNIILYDFAAQKTKFGVCGVKVWISHKKRS